MGIGYYSSCKDGASCKPLHCAAPATAATCLGEHALPQLLQGAGASACKSGSEFCSSGQNSSKTEHVFKLREILCAASALCAPV